MADPLRDPFQHDPAGVRDTADGLLSRPPYATEAEGPLGRVVEVVRDALADLLDTLLAAAGAAPVVAWVIVALAVLLLAVVAWRVLGTVAPDPARAAAGAPLPRRTAADLAADGEAAAAAGDHDRAALTLYHAAVVRLEEQGVLDDQAGRTIRELDAEVARAAPDLAPDLAAAGQVIDRVLYAGASATPDDVAVVRAALTAAEGGGRARTGLAGSRS